MLEIALLILIGMFIGWNLPQPKYAKALQDLVVSWYRRLRR